MNEIMKNIKNDILKVSKDLLIYAILATVSIFILGGVIGLSSLFSPAFAIILIFALGIGEIIFIIKIYFKYGNKILQTVLAFDEDYKGYNYTKNLIVVVLLSIALSFINIILIALLGGLGFLVGIIMYFANIYISLYFILEKRNIRAKQFFIIALYNLVFIILLTLAFIFMFILLMIIAVAIGTIFDFLGVMIFLIGFVALLLFLVSAQFVITFRVLLFFTKINQREVKLAKEIQGKKEVKNVIINGEEVPVINEDGKSKE